jgi:CheY-like chemotaxis protein
MAGSRHLAVAARYRQSRRQRQIERIMTTAVEPLTAPLRILFVEDDIIIQFSTAEMLRELGHEVTATSNAIEALRELESGGFDILFTDVSLPGRSGVELAREARGRLPDLRVIFASGYGDAVLSAGAASEGAILLPKPYSFANIEQAIQNAVRG